MFSVMVWLIEKHHKDTWRYLNVAEQTAGTHVTHSVRPRSSVTAQHAHQTALNLNVSFYFWPWDGVLNLMSCIRSQCAPISLYGFPCIDFNHVSVILLVTSVPHHKATNHYYYIVFVFWGGGWYLWLISQLAPCVSLKFTQFTLYMLFFHLSTSCFLLFYMHKVNVSKNLKDYNELNAPVTLSQGVLRSQNSFFFFFFCKAHEYFIRKTNVMWPFSVMLLLN